MNKTKFYVCCCHHSHKRGCKSSRNKVGINHEKHIPMCCEPYKKGNSHSQECFNKRLCNCEDKHKSAGCTRTAFCTCPIDAKDYSFKRMQNLHVAECEYLIKLQKDKLYTDQQFAQSEDYPGYYFPCCCGLNDFEHTEAGKIKLRTLDDQNIDPVLFVDPMTGELHGLIDEDFVSHVKVPNLKKLTFLLLKAIFNNKETRLIETNNSKGLDVALCATDYATERRNWMRKRAIIKLDEKSGVD